LTGRQLFALFGTALSSTAAGFIARRLLRTWWAVALSLVAVVALCVMFFWGDFES